MPFLATLDAPDLRFMSMDRWKIWTINEEMELMPHTKRIREEEEREE